MRWTRKEPRRPPDQKRLLSAADVGCRLLCARRALHRWMEDRFLEKDEFKAMWQPFKGFLEHLFVLLVMNLTCLCRLDRVMFATHNALEDVYVGNHFADSGPVGQMIVFSEIDTLERLWLFMGSTVDSVTGTDPPGVTPENMLVGHIRFRQVRVKASPCIISRLPELAGAYKSCHGLYGLDVDEREPFGLGEGGGEAWQYRLNSDGNPSYGYLFDYAANGYWIDLARDGQGAKEELSTLQNNSWIDEATRAVFANLVTYNANCNEICYTWIRFEMPPGGGVVPFLDAFCAPLQQYATAFDHWRLGHEVLFAMCTAVLSLAELRRIIRHRGRLHDAYGSAWNLMKAFILAACWLTLYYGVRRFLETQDLLRAMQEDGLATTHRSGLLYYHQLWANRWLSAAVFVAWLRTFHYQRVTTQVLVTLERSRGDLAGYIVMYVVLHGAFALAGYYLFGNQMFVFKTFSESALAILAFALGEMRSDEILVTFWLTGPFYFLLLIFIVIFVFHNMFFVILSYNYDSVREERSQLDRGLDFGAFMRNGYLNVRKALGRPVPQTDLHDDLERRLIRCGFSLGSLQIFRTLLQPKQGYKMEQADVTGKDLKLVEEEIEGMEKELTQAKNELGGLVSSLSGELRSGA